MLSKLRSSVDKITVMCRLRAAHLDSASTANVFDIRHPDHGTLSYWLCPDHRGRGYATEAAALLCDHAFRTLGLHRLDAWTIAYNEASQALLRRLGFTHEGTFRERVFRKGEHHDTEHYGPLASEWEGVEAVSDDRFSA